MANTYTINTLNDKFAAIVCVNMAKINSEYHNLMPWWLNMMPRTFSIRLPIAISSENVENLPHNTVNVAFKFVTFPD